MSPYERSPKVDPESNEKLSSDRTSKKIGGKVLRIRNLIIGAGVAAVIVGGGLYMNSLSSNADKNPEQNQSQTVDQEKKERNLQEIIAEYDNKQPSAEEIAEQFKMPTGLDDDQMAEEFISKLNKWMSFGTDPLLTDEYVHSQTDINGFDDRIDGITAKNAKIIALALLGDYEYDSKSKFTERMQTGNSEVLHSNISNDLNAIYPEDESKRFFRVTKVKNTSRESHYRELSISFEEVKNNTEKQPVKKRITITSNNKCLYCFFISITSLKKFYFF